MQPTNPIRIIVEPRSNEIVVKSGLLKSRVCKRYFIMIIEL